MKRLNRSILLSAAISSLIPLNTYAAALEEIIVTATKQLASSQDVAISLVAFSNETLEELGVENTQDLQLISPSLVFTNRVNNSGAFIRGIGTKLSLVGLEPSIATYLDDQYLSRPVGAIIELPDVERVEVLKGPQGTLFGRNATGGALRIVSKTPSHTFGGKIVATTGNYGYLGGKLYLEGGLTDDLTANLSVLVKDRDGYSENQVAGKHDIDDMDLRMYRSKFVWQINNSASGEFVVGYSHQKDTMSNETNEIGVNGVSLAEFLGGTTGTDQKKVYASMDEPSETKLLNVQMRFDIERDEMDIVSITTYQDLEAKLAGDFDGTNLRVADFLGAEDAETFTQEFQLISTSDDALQWIVGVYYFDSDSSSAFSLDRTDAGLPGAFLPRSVLETKAWAVFGQGTYEFNDEWALTLGLRYSAETKDIVSETSGPTPHPTLPGVVIPAGVQLVAADDDWSSVSPKLTLEYRTFDSLYYFTLARGFKSGGYANPVPANGESLDEEILTMYEFGWKSDLLDNTLRINGALYYYDYQDLQVNSSAGGSADAITLVTKNAAGAKITGLEVDVTWAATDQLTIMMGFNLMDTEFQDYTDANANVWGPFPPPPPLVGVSFDASGDSLPQASDVAAYLSLGYEFRLGSATMPLSLIYSYKGGFDFDLIPNQSDIAAGLIPATEAVGESYSLLNARLQYLPAKNWEVSAWVRNVTDEEYFDEIVVFALSLRGSYGAPRTYGVDFTYRF